MKTKIKDEFPALKKYTVQSHFDELKIPDGMIDLIKEFLPLTLTVGTVWGKSKPQDQRDQTDILHDRCNELRKKLLAFDFYGKITIVANSCPIILDFYFDEELEEESMNWIETQVITYDFEWSKNL